MIYDRIESAETYLGIHPNLDRALREIRKGAYTAWENGRHTVDGDKVFCNVISPAYRNESIWERHENYLDIHISFDGAESIRAADQNEITGWTPYDPAGDCATAAYSEAGVKLPMKKGWFLVVFPQDAHMPCLSAEAENGRKAIFKVQIKA